MAGVWATRAYFFHVYKLEETRQGFLATSLS